MADGLADVGLSVGIELGAGVLVTVGAAEGRGVGSGVGFTIDVGDAVGLYVTSCKPVPAMTAVPVHVVEPVQPSRMMYVWEAIANGTVYCTCAHTLPPEMQAAGGRLPKPVSSYTTSTPAAV
jgi:hypothetical protein